MLAPSWLSRSARSSYPRAITYVERSTEVPLLASIASRITTAGRRHLRDEASVWLRYSHAVTRALRASPAIA